MTVIKIGCDPEGFIVDPNGDFISAYGIIPGDKKDPFKVDGGAVQVDGMALEFNIDPASTEDEFVGNIKKVITQVTEMVHDASPDLSIRWTPIARFKNTIWEVSPEQCKILGCDPDYNIHGEINENPILKLENTPIRTAAGHIHIGFRDTLIEDPMDKDHFDTCLYLAQGFFNSHVPSYIPHLPEEEERMKYYGAWGSFRPKKYGVELRSPSNIWVAKEETQRKIYRETRNTFNDLTGL